MNFFIITLIAVGLAMDTFAVSIVTGAVYRQLKVKYAFRMALFFGGFQAFMPVIGYFTGLGVEQYITAYDHWVAFALLIAVGSRMIYESFKITPQRANFDPSNIPVLLVLSLATSIDALAIGMTLSFLKVAIVVAVVIIGLVTFLLSYVGVFVGKKFGHFFENKIEALGGLILIGIGAKILLEHSFH